MSRPATLLKTVKTPIIKTVTFIKTVIIVDHSSVFWPFGHSWVSARKSGRRMRSNSETGISQECAESSKPALNPALNPPEEAGTSNTQQ